ncbi:MAG TPA: DUF6585 family protein [Nannocystaceae bacterium]|nr:DUF6585 family protein [Nannocystaceae bacterium]
MALPTAMIETLEGTTYPRWFGGVGAAFVLVGALGFFAGIDALRASPPRTVIGIVGIGSLVVLVAVLVVAAKLVRRRLIVDKDGIEVRMRSGEVMRIRWAEPHDFYFRALATAGVTKASVRAADGRRIDVDSVRVRGTPNAGVPAFVEQCSTAANWPKISARLGAGEDVQFGKVRLSNERVQVGRTALPLDRPIEVRVHNGKIELKGAGKWFVSDVWVRQVANYPCFLRALAERTKSA